MGFKKGDPNINRNGRPKKEVCIPDILREILSQPEGEDIDITKLHAILHRVVENALKGDSWSIQYISDRTEGKSTIRNEIKINTKEKFTGENAEEYVRNALSQNRNEHE